MITVGTMQLHQPEAPDQMEPFFVGGEYHTDMSRLSSHDHSGGLLGAPVAVTIPDGSITTADLDPSVLAPYALTDGSKPFSGQVTLQADAVVRDALHFGEQGSAAAPDALLSRTAPGALRAWGPLTADGALTAQGGTAGLVFASRSSADLWQWYADAAGAYLHHSTPGAARLAVNGSGTLTVTPAAGQRALSASGDAYSFSHHPLTDATYQLGYSALKWTSVWATNGVIQTSSREQKTGVAPLDPQRAMEAVRNTPAVTFDYVAPTRGPDYYDLPDDPEQAEAVLAQRLTAAPLEAAARHQHGFIAEDCDPLFLVGEGQTSPGSSIGVLLAALQHMDSRLAALEGA